MSRDKMPGHFDGDGCVFPDSGHFAHAHTKVNEEVYSEYDCTFKDCDHDECPTERMDICKECSQWSWEEHEGGVVTWMECLDNLALDEFDVPTDRENGSER